MHIRVTLTVLAISTWVHPVAAWFLAGGSLPATLLSRARPAISLTKCQVGTLYTEQEALIVKRGEAEGDLMKNTILGAIQANIPKIKGVGASGGFGGKKSKKAVQEELKAAGKSHAAVLKQEGVVRIDNVLTPETADCLRSWAFEHRIQALADVESGKIGQLYRFADVLLKTNRCDLTMPIGEETVTKALTEVLCDSSVSNTMQHLLGDAAPLYELSCLISDPGSQRQTVHPDTPYGGRSGLAEDEPVLYTCFIALQDVRPDMGPTVWLPGTHTKEAHAQFGRTNQPGSDKDALLSSVPSVLGLLPKGCCAIFDSRTLHAGGSNQSKSDSRALFYFTFKNPKVINAGNPGSIRPELINKITLQTLKKELGLLRDNGSSAVLDSLAASLH